MVTFEEYNNCKNFSEHNYIAGDCTCGTLFLINDTFSLLSLSILPLSTASSTALRRATYNKQIRTLGYTFFPSFTSMLNTDPVLSLYFIRF